MAALSIFAMPLRKRAYYKRHNVGADMKQRQLEWEAGEQLLEKEKTLRAKQERLKRLEKKVEQVVREIEETEEIGLEMGAVQPAAKQKESFLSEQGISARQKRPTGMAGLGAAARRQRRADTFQAACEIHRAKKEDVAPAVAGLVDTISKKSPESLIDSLGRSNKLKKGLLKGLQERIGAI